MHAMSARRRLLFVALIACSAPMIEAAGGKTQARGPIPSSSPTDAPSPIVQIEITSAPTAEESPTASESPTATPLASESPIATPLASESPIATPLASMLVPSPSPHAKGFPNLRPPLPGFGLSDTIDQLLIGAWQCQTFGGTALTHVYSRGDDLSALLVDTQLTLANHQSATIHETYTHHVGVHAWTAILANGAFIATAPDWTGGTWIFTGQSTEGGKASKVQMIYTPLGRDAFRRDFQRAEAAVWVTYAGETCRRNS